MRALEVDALTRSQGDRAGTATVLGALLPFLGRLPDSIAEMRRHGPPLVRIPGAGNQRGVALALHAWLAPKLAGLDRCPSGDPCPTCREGEPCPLDVWRTALVPSVLGPRETQIVAFWDTNAQATSASQGAGRGYLAMRRVAPELADAVLRSCVEFYRARGDRLTPALIAEGVWQAVGCDDPAMTEIRATTKAAVGRPADLAAALRVCHAVLRRRDGSTDPAWTSLATRAAQLSARARRIRRADRHTARRLVRAPRDPRFLRAS